MASIDASPEKVGWKKIADRIRPAVQDPDSFLDLSFTDASNHNSSSRHLQPVFDCEGGSCANR